MYISRIHKVFPESPHQLVFLAGNIWDIHIMGGWAKFF
jgi:hypothetical protein